jgi:nucleoid DNA-binding protein
MNKTELTKVVAEKAELTQKDAGAGPQVTAKPNSTTGFTDVW